MNRTVSAFIAAFRVRHNANPSVVDIGVSCGFHSMEDALTRLRAMPEVTVDPRTLTVSVLQWGVARPRTAA